MEMVVLWAILAALFFVIEIVTVGMVSVWFVVGALAGFVAALLGARLWLQLVLFIVVSVACFLVFYPRVKRLVQKNQQATNADRALGRTCVVTRRIDNMAGTGAVNVDGQIWSARAENGTVIEEGAQVVVQSIQGVKLLVLPAEKENT